MKCQPFLIRPTLSHVSASYSFACNGNEYALPHSICNAQNANEYV
jgi:hypothetical protein